MTQAPPVKLSYPPGLDRTGTEYQSQGRWWESDLIRWFLGRVRAIGGWVSMATGLTGQVSGMFSWVTNSAAGLCAIGTESKLYTMTTGGTVTDRTPTGFAAQATTSTWTFDNAGQLLLGVNDADGTIYKFLPGTDTLASALEDEAGAASVPTAQAIVVTNEGIPMALGVNGNPRRIAWSDRDDITDWTAGFADLAGDLDMQSPAGLMCGANVRAGTLLWTREDLHLARYVGLPDVYGTEPVGEDCGAISRRCVAVVNDVAYWMSDSKFFMCQGGGLTIEMPCLVHDDVFKGLDTARAHLVRALVNSEFNEIWWLYRKAADSGTANTRVVVYNYMEKTWGLHLLARHDGIGRGRGFGKPVMVGGSTVWMHETGLTRSGAGTPYARSGPVEIGDGERLLHVRELIPDEMTQGDVQIWFYARLFPNGQETEHGPYTAGLPTNVRFCGRQVSIKLVEAAANDWRIGDFRLVGQPGSRR